MDAVAASWTEEGIQLDLFQFYDSAHAKTEAPSSQPHQKGQNILLLLLISKTGSSRAEGHLAETDVCIQNNLISF